MSTLWREHAFILRFASMPPRICAPETGSCVVAASSGRLAWVVLGLVLGLLAVGVAPVDLRVAGFSALLLLGAFAYPVAATASLPLVLVATPRLVLDEAGGEALFLRVEHFLVAGTLLGFLWRRELRAHALHAWYALALAAFALSACAGLSRGSTAPAGAAAFLAQTGLLGLVLVLAHTAAPRLGDAGMRVFLLSLCGFAAYGIAEMFWPLESTGGYRTYERIFFDGQANHAGGLLAAGIVVGLVLVSVRPWRCFALAAILLCTLALAGTRSREGMLAAAAGIFTVFACQRPRMALGIALTGMLMLALSPSWLGASLAPPGSSVAHRIEHWHNALLTLPSHPWLGLGPGARHRAYYDNYYVMLIVECGLLGLGAWGAWLITCMRSFTSTRGEFHSRLGLPVLVVLIVQGGAAVIFLVTLTAGPLLWLVGYLLPQKTGAADGP